MMSSVFDSIAANYDTLWTQSVIGRCQREAVWRWLDPLIRHGDRILDLGCGSGEDALHLMQTDAEVYGIDASAEMVRIAIARGVNAKQMPAEALSALTGSFDGAISNFGVLNCVRDLKPVASALSRLVRAGGFLALCIIGPFCAWETLYWAARGKFKKAVRRLSRNGAPSSLGVHVRYPSVAQIRRALSPGFRLTRWTGIGVCVPPSYVAGISVNVIEHFTRIDHRIAHWPGFRATADHRLLLFTRV